MFVFYISSLINCAPKQYNILDKKCKTKQTMYYIICEGWMTVYEPTIVFIIFITTSRTHSEVKKGCKPLLSLLF